jgi:hypothetical protein
MHINTSGPPGVTYCSLSLPHHFLPLQAPTLQIPA